MCIGAMGFDGALAGRGTPSSFALSARFLPPVNCVLASVSALSLRIASALACCAASAALSGAQAPVLRRVSAAANCFSAGSPSCLVRSSVAAQVAAKPLMKSPSPLLLRPVNWIE